MTHDETRKSQAAGSPAMWNAESLRGNWEAHLAGLSAECGMPLGRLRFQAEGDPAYAETLARWDRLGGAERVGAWKRLIEIAGRHAEAMLPTCARCGECCRRGSPTLLLADLDVLRGEKIPWSALLTLRRGEPVRTPEGKPFFLLDERVKLRERPASSECVFFSDSGCAMYAARPTQCRAQACWDPEPSRDLEGEPYLTRRDIFAGAEALLELLAEHDRRCGFEALARVFEHLRESSGESIAEVLDIFAFDEHFREFVTREFGMPPDLSGLVFGRPLSDFAPLFGFRVEVEADGTRRLVPDPQAAQGPSGG